MKYACINCEVRPDKTFMVIDHINICVCCGNKYNTTDASLLGNLRDDHPNYDMILKSKPAKALKHTEFTDEDVTRMMHLVPIIDQLKTRNIFRIQL